MAAELNLEYYAELSGLGANANIMAGRATVGQTPTAVNHQYRTLAVADTAEALDLGDISTVDLIVLRAIDYDLDVDTSYVSSFNAEITALAGETPLIFKPTGTVYVKNNGDAETVQYEYLIVGRT